VREHWSPLYNGNIAHSVNTLQPFGTWSANGGQAQVLAQVYAYDQLNRLQKSRGIIGLGASNNWEGITDANAWRYVSEYGYDANGNITDCDRYTGDTGLRYDVLRYKYQKQQGSGRLLRNRLYHVHSDHDNLATTDIGDYADDLANFNDPHNTNGTINTANPYGYDALGNLARNTHDGISAIDWTVAGKVKNVHRMGGSALPKLQFGYGASGQRIMKQVGVPGQDAGAYREHYIRDAQGNIMATYRYTNASSASLKLSERPIYGSSRLGSLRKEVEVYNAPTSISPGANPVQLVELNYELTDHLGNVSAVVTGRLLTNLFGITPCQAELVSAQGYEPFGSLLPGRNYSSASYNYGFNGQLKDDEVYGSSGTSYTAEFWQYDPRIARRWNIDPITKPHESGYAAFALSPIQFADPLGNDTVSFRGDNGNMFRFVHDAFPKLMLDVKGDIAESVVVDLRNKAVPEAIGYSIEGSLNGSAGPLSASAKGSIASYTVFTKGEYAWQPFAYAYASAGAGAAAPASGLPNGNAALTTVPFAAWWNGRDEQITPQTWEGIGTVLDVSVSFEIEIGVVVGAGYFQTNNLPAGQSWQGAYFDYGVAFGGGASATAQLGWAGYKLLERHPQKTKNISYATIAAKYFDMATGTIEGTMLSDRVFDFIGRK
jgi:hypothetical protein